MSELKMYTGFSRGFGTAEGAVLIFAHNAREAKKVGFACSGHEITGGEYIDFGVHLIRGADYLYQEADQEKLANGIPHIIDNPKSCKGCEMWGYEILEDGYCTECKEEEDE